MPQLASVRSNMHLEVDYKTSQLVPMAEIIMLFAHPVYSLSSDGETVKNVGIQETRFKATKESVDTLISQLQEISKMLAPFAELASDFNESIIKTPKTPNA